MLLRRSGDLLTTRGRASLAAGITLMISGYGLGFRDLTRIGALLVVLTFFASILARRRPPGLVIERVSTPMRVVAEDPADIETTVRNEGNGPTPLMLAEERLDYLLGERPRVLVGSLRPGEHKTIRYAVRPPVRGRHQLGPLTVQLRDPFGMTNRFVQVGAGTELLVLPRTYPLSGSRPPGTGVGADGEIPFMVALHGEDDQSIREYRDGDDLRRIHWPATARTGELMVRQEDRPARRRAVLLLDPRPEGHFGSGPGGSFEWGVSAIASILVHLSDLGYAVHLLTPEVLLSGHHDEPTDPVAGLDVLAVTAPADGASADGLIRAAQTLLGGGGLFVAVLTDHDEALLHRVASLRQPGATALAFVLAQADRASRSPSPVAAQVLLGAGWRVATVHPSDTVTQAWTRVSSRGVAVGVS